MKKWLFALAASLLIISLAACGQGTVKVESTEKKSKEIDVAKVMSDAIAASKELKSFSIDMNVNQHIKMGENEEVEVNSAITSDMTLEPLAFYQNMSMESSDIDQKMKMESYMTEEGFFMYSEEFGQWMKLPNDMYKELSSLSNMEQDPSGDLEQLKQFADDFKIEETSSSYILTLKASGEKFTDFVKEQVKETMPDLAAEDDIFANMSFKEVSYLYEIDKKTHYPVKLDMIMDVTFADSGEEIALKMDMKGTYSKFNEIDGITVPQDVLQTAQEMPDPAVTQ